MIAGGKILSCVLFSIMLLSIFHVSVAFAQVGTISNNQEEDVEKITLEVVKELILNATRADETEEEVCANYGRPVIYLHTDNERYLTGSKIIVSGKVFDQCGSSLITPVTIEVFTTNGTRPPFVDQLTEKNLFLQQSRLSDSGEFRQVIDIREASPYIIKATITDQNVTESSFLPIQIRGFAGSGVGIGIYAEIFFIACLLTLIYAQLRHGWSIPSIEPFRFGLLTLCSVIPIIIFMSADVQLGQDSPFGFVIKHFEEPIKEITFERLTEATGTVEVSQEENIVSRFEWVINVGGTSVDNYNTGIQIPVFVLIFGLIGGYLRYLRKTSQGWVQEKVQGAVEFFKKDQEKLPDWARKTTSELLANRYYITTPAGEVFNREEVCHICNMHKEFIQIKGEPICPECFRKRSKSCNYCKMKINQEVKNRELPLKSIEERMVQLKEERPDIVKKLKEDDLDNDELQKYEMELKSIDYALTALELKRAFFKEKLEPLYIKRTTEISKNGRCQNILLEKDLESLEIDNTNESDEKICFGPRWKREFIGTKKGEKCNRLNLDNKHAIQRWKNKSKLQKRFYPQVKRAIFNNSMEDLALIFLPPVLAFALYFVLLQAGITAQENMPTIAAVSLAVGLITKEALQRLESLGRGFLVGEKTTSEDEVNDMKDELEKYKNKDLNKLKVETKKLIEENEKIKSKLERLKEEGKPKKEEKPKK